MKKRTNNQPTSKDLTALLWDTINKVKTKKIKPAEANSISKLSREMLNISRLRLEYAKLSGSKVTQDTLMLS